MTLKKSALSIAVAGALGVAASPALAGDTGGYGRLDVGVLSFDDGTDSSLDVSGVNSRFGWKGTEDLGNGMMAEYRYEFRVFADRADIAGENRLSWVGLKGDVAGVRIGRQWAAGFNHFGTYMDPTLYTGTGNPSPYRQSDTVKVHGSAGVVNWEADVIMNGGADTADDDEGVDRFEAGATFGVGPANVSVAMINDGKGGIAVAGDDNEDLSAFGVAGSMGVGKGITIRAGFASFDDGSDESTTFAGVNASIAAGGGLSFLVHVDSTSDDDGDTAGGDSISSFMLGAYKSMSKRTRVYAELLQRSPDEGDDVSSLYAGIRHDY